MNGYVAVFLVGGVGCIARMAVSWWCAVKFGPSFPVGTLVVNVLGCFLIGVFAGLTRPDGGWELPPIVRQAVMLGFFGGFTTFSSFALQTLNLVNDGQWLFASLNVGLSVFLCLVAVWLGWMAALLLIRPLP
jgi:CrcB protein